MQRKLLLIVLVILVSTSCIPAQMNGGIQKYCGRNLVNILTMVCDGIYNQMALKEGHDPTAKDDSQQKIDSSVFREKRSVTNIFKERIHRRQRRGAYEECCRKGCTIDEMIGYCGNS